MLTLDVVGITSLEDKTYEELVSNVLKTLYNV